MNVSSRAFVEPIHDERSPNQDLAVGVYRVVVVATRANQVLDTYHSPTKRALTFGGKRCIRIVRGGMGTPVSVIPSDAKSGDADGFSGRISTGRASTRVPPRIDERSCSAKLECSAIARAAGGQHEI